jgi:hypothetical protein
MPLRSSEWLGFACCFASFSTIGRLHLRVFHGFGRRREGCRHHLEIANLSRMRVTVEL